MKPYLLTAGSTAFELGISVITPLTDEVVIPYIHGYISILSFIFFVLTPWSWDYMLWKDIYVAPIVEDSLKRFVIDAYLCWMYLSSLITLLGK